MENRPLASYAALCGIAEAYFRSLFTAHYGVSPVEYRNRLRISYARALMDHCGLTIADAARAAGFSSASYFCRLYKKTTGMSPGEERRDGEMGD